MDWKEIHERAVRVASDLKRSESELIGVLQEVEREKIYERFGKTSLFAYCTDVLGLSPDRTSTFISIARKAVEVPVLKKAIEENKLSISNAKLVVKVITPENKEEWMIKGTVLSSRALEKAIAVSFPKEALPEKVKPLAENLYELRCSLSSKGEKLLARALDLLSQKHKKAVNRGEAIEEVLEAFIEKNDPVKKAERCQKVPVARRNVYREGKRRAVPRANVHQVMKETQGQCTHVDSKGMRCQQRRWVEVHHLREVSRGGSHDVNNLTVLCSGHHRMRHGA